jgi:putative hydrolase of the HAD superfamily
VEAYGEQNRLAWEAITPPEFTCPSHMDILSATLATCKLETNRIDMLQVQKLFAWKLIPGVCLFDDAIDVLKILRTANLKTGLITNATMPMWMRDIELKSLDLLEYLDVRLAAGDLGRFKPHPAPFREALKRLKIAPEEAIFVGDRVQDDVAGAQAAGMRAVWVRRGTEVSNGSCKPNATITSLRELPATLDVWYPGWR